MKKLLVILLLFFVLGCEQKKSDDTCVDKNPEIILDLGGSPEPEKIIYATYHSCTKMHDYCGAMGCQLNVFDDKGNEVLSYLYKEEDWYIRPTKGSGLSKKPTYELVVPLANGNLRIVKVINNKITEVEINPD